MDTEVSGDERLTAFFREAQAAQVRIAERDKQLLRIVQSLPEFGVGSGAIFLGSYQFYSPRAIFRQ